MTRIPTATRRQRIEVRASQTGPKLPRLHALPTPMACRGPTLITPNSAGLGYRPTDMNVSPGTDRRKALLPAGNDRVSTLATHGRTATRRMRMGGGASAPTQHDHQSQHHVGLSSGQEISDERPGPRRTPANPGHR